MGKIYTGYFAGWRAWPTGALAIGVTRFKPDYWTGINLDKLAPSAELLRQYRNNYIDEYMFKNIYLSELNNRGLTPNFVRQSLKEAAGERDIILCCYEKPNEFCHRHILNEWLGGDGEIGEVQ